MRKYKNRFCCAILIIVMLLSMLPTAAFAADEIDFSVHFNSGEEGVKITAPGGSALPAVVAKDAPIEIICYYTLKADLTDIDKTYTFNIPKEVAPTESEPVPGQGIDAGMVIFDFTVDQNGVVEVKFTQDAKDGPYLDAGETGSFKITTAFNPDELSGGGAKKLTFFEGSANEIDVDLIFAFDQIEAGGGISSYDVVDIDESKNQIEWKFNFKPEMKNNTLDPTGDDEITNLILDIAEVEDLEFLTDDPSLEPTALLNDSDTLGGTFEVDSDTGHLIYKVSNYTYAKDDVITVTYNTTYSMSAFKESNEKVFEGSVSGSFVYPQYKMEAGVISLSSETKTATIAVDTAETEVKAMFLDKKSSPISSTMEITWTVTVNGSGFNFGTDGETFDVKDAIPNGLKLISVKLDGGSPLTIGDVYDGSDYAGGTLTVQVSKNDPHSIEYVTEIDPAIWKVGKNRNFENKVQYEYDGEGKGFYRSKKAEGNFASSTGGLLSGTGSYDSTNHTITWKFGVNGYGAPLTGGKVAIKIPDGLTYDGDASSLVLPSTDYSAVYSSETITITLPTDAKGEIILKTTVDKVSRWGTNNADTPQSIEARLTATGGIALTVTPKTTVETKVISKRATNYDYATKKITWEVTFNQNDMEMTNPVIVDTLPVGLTYVTGTAAAITTGTGAAVIKTDGITYDEGKRELTVAFENTSAASGKTYGFTFETEVAESQRQKPTDVINTAAINFKELVDGGESPVSTKATKEVGKAALIKSGDGNTTENKKNRIITWTVNINTNEVALTHKIIEDNLPAGLMLDLESVQLYECTINAADGALIKGTKVYDGKTPTATNADYAATLVGQLFSFEFKNEIKKAYQLVFDTDNFLPTGTDYKNSVNFKGVAADPLSSSGTINQGAMASGGINRPDRGSIKLTAQDNSGNKLANITYTLTSTTNPNDVYTVTTGTDGIANFAVVKFGTYTITQAGVSAGLGLMAALPTITVEKNDSDESKKHPTDLINYTTGTLVALNYNANGGAGTGYSEESYGSGANVTVRDNPFTRTNYTFENWNTQANGGGTAYDPADGFVITENTTLYAIWTWAGGSMGGDPSPVETPKDTEAEPDGTGDPAQPDVTPEPQPATLPAGWANTTSADVSAYTGVPLARGRGGLVLSAVTVSGVMVPGVVFEIELNGEILTQPTDENGVAVFRDIEPGEYVVKVLSVPAGYELAIESEITVAVKEDEYFIAEALLPLAAAIPKTGDMLPLGLLLVMAGMSLILGAGGVIASRRKKNEGGTAD